MSRAEGSCAPSHGSGGSTGEGRLPYTPALDSLRALAVIAVLVYHQAPGLVAGGWLGVSLFFTLSGFLITNLLLAEHAETGRVDLMAFWGRRLRRLLPASVLALGLGAIVLAAQAPDRHDLVLDLRAAALNVANWRFISSGSSYGDLDGLASPVQHYWSLAIEEQFYVVLPLLAAGLLARRRWFVVAIGAVFVGSLASQVWAGHGVDRIYFGSDTRAAELAVGVALALALPTLSALARGRERWIDAWGVVALVSAGAVAAQVELTGAVVTSGALAAVPVIWVGLLVACVLGSVVPRHLARGGLPAVGRISYGIYLFHWPIFLLLSPDRVGVDGAPLFAARVACTVALAAASARLVEMPIRRATVPDRRTVAVAFATVACVVAVTAVPRADDAVGLEVAGAELVAPDTTRVPRPTTSTTVADGSSPTIAPVITAAPTSTEPSVAPVSAAPTTAPPPPPPTTALRPPRVLVVGDSTAGPLGAGLQAVGTSDGSMETFVLQLPGCATLRYDYAVLRDGFEYRTSCGDILAEAATTASDLDIDAVVVLIGNLTLADDKYPGVDGVRSITDPVVDRNYRAALTERIRGFTDRGIAVLWADVPVPAWEVDEMSALLGRPIPGSGPATTNDPARTARLNAIDADVIRGFPGAARWGYSAALAGPDGTIDPGLRFDGLHIDDATAERLARETILDQLEQAYRGIRARVGGPADTTWDS